MPTKQASFAPRKIVKSRVRGAWGAVDWAMMRSKSGRRQVDVYLYSLFNT